MLVFIDESGYPRPTDATNNPVLLAVCLHENDIKSITNQIYKLKDSIYGKQDEIKSTKNIIVPEHHLPKQYYLLLKKIEYYCKYRNLGKAILIFDEIHEEADRKITEAFTSFLFKTNFGRSFEHILEMPLFVSSAVTPSIQFADMFHFLKSYNDILKTHLYQIANIPNLHFKKSAHIIHIT
ncbi:MAG: DUF3800 domain-containing protein [Agathobacter sp.]|nr:DUF3800 domain-containing protein [Agathobacter sp.]